MASKVIIQLPKTTSTNLNLVIANIKPWVLATKAFWKLTNSDILYLIPCIR